MPASVSKAAARVSGLKRGAAPSAHSRRVGSRSSASAPLDHDAGTHESTRTGSVVQQLSANEQQSAAGAAARGRVMLAEEQEGVARPAERAGRDGSDASRIAELKAQLAEKTSHLKELQRVVQRMRAHVETHACAHAQLAL